MIFKQQLLLFLFISIGFSAVANDTTYVKVDLNSHDQGKLKIIVYPPDFSANETEFIIPSIIPGTYLQVNYHRFYSNFKAFDANGDELKFKQNKSHITIKGESELARLEFEVEHSRKDFRIWDNILSCAGTVFKDSSFLMNYQLITGYFKGFQQKPVKVSVLKQEFLHGSTALTKISSTPMKDIYVASNYDELVEKPMLYCTADTSSFMVSDARFNVSVFSETGKITALQVKPKLQKIMAGIYNFSGELASKDYHFILYFESSDSLKGVFKSFGMGSALEHLNSSVYYLNESMDTSFKYLNYIAAHEYFHTWSPLTVHSEKIEFFNFDQPDMSKHLWLYEGVTDYLATLMSTSEKINLYQGFNSSMASSLSAAKRRKARSMTKSSQNIINHNAFDWIGKIIQLGNFYEKGKFIAFSMDMELFLQSNGTYRLRDLMLDLHKKYEGSYFKDDEFLDDLVEMTFPEMKPFVDNYIVGKQIPPYEFYFDKMGKKFMAEGTKKASYGRPHWGYDQKTGQYFVSKYDESNLQAKVGDTLYSVNDTLLTRERMNKVWYQLYYPEKKEEIKLTVLRNGEQVELRGKATKKTKNRYAYLLSKEERTEEQNDLYKQFIYYKQD